MKFETCEYESETFALSVSLFGLMSSGPSEEVDYVSY